MEAHLVKVKPDLY